MSYHPDEEAFRDLKKLELRTHFPEPQRFPVGLKQVKSNARLPPGVLAVAAGGLFVFNVAVLLWIKYAVTKPMGPRTYPTYQLATADYAKEFCVNSDEPVRLAATGGYDPYSKDNHYPDRVLYRVKQ